MEKVRLELDITKARNDHECKLRELEECATYSNC